MIKCYCVCFGVRREGLNSERTFWQKFKRALREGKVGAEGEQFKCDTISGER